MPTDTLSPARRDKLLRAHQLRCQGLTLRQIAEQMNCSPATVLRYLREFQQYRSQIIESLASDQLLDLLQQLGDTDDSAHERRIHAARELRLLLDALDRIVDRRQQRDRRIEEQHAADSLRTLDALETVLHELAAAGLEPLDLSQVPPSELPGLISLHQIFGGDLADETPESILASRKQAPSQPEPNRIFRIQNETN